MIIVIILIYVYKLYITYIDINTTLSKRKTKKYIVMLL